MTEHPGRRLTIIGGGVMGLMTAYYAAPLAGAVTVLEGSRVGDPATASFGLTRSARNDYLDPQYARLAFEARQLWLELQEKAGQPLLIDCGCLNLAKGSVTPDLGSTYAAQSFAVLDQLQLRREAFSPASCGRGSRSSTPTAAGSTWTPARRRRRGDVSPERRDRRPRCPRRREHAAAGHYPLGRCLARRHRLGPGRIRCPGRDRGAGHQ